MMYFCCRFSFASMLKKVKATSRHYRNSEETSRIIYLTGTYDPWSPLGVSRQTQISNESVVIVMKGI